MSKTNYLFAEQTLARLPVVRRGATYRTSRPTTLCCALFALASCAQGIVPTVQVLPPTGKPFAAFQADQHDCSILAGNQVRPMMDRAAYAGLGTAVIGTALGAGLGAAIGGGRGAGIGAAAGAIGGTGVAADQGESSDARIQNFYDNTYASCMSAHGNVVQLPQTVVVAAPPIVIQPAPYVVQPAPYGVTPAYASPPPP
jgi:outer membrane lipoprotein SlyB